jgi:preprotein translocase subunit SecG
MIAFVITLQVLVALFLILVVLLQPGNRGGSAAALGGAGSDTVFGARGANTFLSKITFGAAVCFMLTNLMLSFMSSADGSKSVLKVLEEKAKEAPVKTETKEELPSPALPAATEAVPENPSAP